MAVACLDHPADNPAGLHEDASWFAVRVRARQEEIVAAALSQKRYEVLLPQYMTQRRWSDRVKTVTLALFPGYVFARLDIRKRLPLLKTPGVIHIVGAGGDFLPVDSREIVAIQQMAASGRSFEPWPYTSVGRRVRIETGPLGGIEGILTAVDKHHRLVVSVTLLQRSVAVQIDATDASLVDELDGPDAVHLWEPATVGA